MKDVSCKVFEILFIELDKIHRSPEFLCNGTSYDVKYLLDDRANIEWDAYCRIMENTRSVWNDDDYVRLGIQGVEMKLYPFVSAILGLLVNSRELYRFVISPKRGFGDQYFRCIHATLEEIDKDHLNIFLELSQGYQFCKEFFLIAMGVFIAVPAQIHYGHSSVVMDETESGALYEISLPRRNKYIKRIRNVLSFPFSKKAIINELTAAHELLYERYNQLEESQAQIQKQAKQLETAHSIGNIIRHNLDLDFTLEAVAESLVEIAGFKGVEIKVTWSRNQESVHRTVSKGEMMPMDASLIKSLEVHDNSIGSINLWVKPGSSLEEARHLLDYIIPPITMEIMNAISFKLVNDYRKKLENRVEEIQIAVLDERRRISGELHDDLATNLSAIALMSGVTKKDSSGKKMAVISKIAQQSLDKISEIVWTLNSKNDKVENLVAYIRKYAMEYFEPTSIRCSVKLPRELPDITISSEVRRNFFYTVKEALYNIIKHAEATETELKFTIENHQLSLLIKDNGIGFPKEETNRFGNGVTNMRNRMQSVNGECRIENHQGTKVTLTLPV